MTEFVFDMLILFNVNTLVLTCIDVATSIELFFSFKNVIGDRGAKLRFPVIKIKIKVLLVIRNCSWPG